MASQLTPAQMEVTPAGVPPPGVVPNLIDPPSDGYILLIVGSIVMGIMYITAGLRFYTRIFIRGRTSADDWTTLIAIIGATLYFIISIFAVVKGKFGTHMWDLSVAHTLSDPFIISGFFSNWVSALVWPFAKTSFFLMYFDLFRPLKWQRYAIYFGLFVNWGFYISIIIATLYFTSPAPGQSWQESFVDPRYQGALTMTIPIASGSLALDLYILILPMVSIWKLQMTLKRKLGVLAVFATGITACVASSLSIYFKNVLDHNTADFSYYTLPVLIMCLVEMCVGITANCMPSLSQFWRAGGGGFSNLFYSLIRTRSTMPSKTGTENSQSIGVDNWSARKSPRKYSYKNMDDTNPGSLELGQIKSVVTDIRTDMSGNEVHRPGIYLKSGFHQETDSLNSQTGLRGAPHNGEGKGTGEEWSSPRIR